MYAEEYGKENKEIIVMLHGTNFVHTFSRQYILAEKYHLFIPHLMGYGKETGKIFDTDSQIRELVSYITSLHQRVLLVGFSLGAQIAFKLVAEHEELFSGAIMISPWLVKSDKMLRSVMEQNERQYALFQKRWFCNLIGVLNGLSKEWRKEFVEQMQQVTIETIRHSVDNGITLDSVKGFEKVSIPVYAFAGEKEQAEVTGSVVEMEKRNSHCQCRIWKKAAHNIPQLYDKELNAWIVKMEGAFVYGDR